MPKPLDPLEYKIRRQLEYFNLDENELAVSVSGGLDSMVLANAFLQIHKIWKPLKLSFFHVHHGESSDDKTKAFRDRAEEFVTEFSRQNQIPLHSVKAESSLSSEEDFREFRQHEWKKIRVDKILVTAHHEEDLFETRMHRLIRGTGLEGLVAMQVFNGQIFRPLLKISKSEIQAYQERYQLFYVEDPSNQKNDYFRNWLRNEWLPALEKFQKGSSKSLRQSLDNILSLREDYNLFYSTWIKDGRLNRKASIALDFPHQMQLIVKMLDQVGIKEYRRSQLEEIVKRLDRSQNEYTFDLVNSRWKVSRDWVEVSLLD